MGNSRMRLDRLCCFVPLLIAALCLLGCTDWRNTAAKTTNAVAQAGRDAESFVRARCGPGGKIVAAKCHAQGDARCEPFRRCHAAMKTLHSLQVAVLSVKLPLAAASESDRPTIAKLISSLMRAYAPVKSMIANWSD